MMTQPEFVVDREKLEAVQTAIYDAPRERVWEAMTDPELIPQWWGPAVLKTTVEKMDVRAGGSWRFIQVDPDGNRHVFSGEYREVVPPERSVSTFVYENVPGDRMLETAELEELPDGRTRVTTRSRFESLEALEGAVSSGMESGATESMVRFGELVERG